MKRRISILKVGGVLRDVTHTEIAENSAFSISSLELKMEYANNLEDFYKLNKPILTALIKKKLDLITDEDREDILHDYIVHIDRYSTLAKFNPALSKFQTYMTRTLLNYLEYRGKSITYRHKNFIKVPLDNCYHENLTEEPSVSFNKKILEQIMSKLGPSEVDMIEGLINREMSQKDYAKEIGLTFQAVCIRWKKLVAKMQRLVREGPIQ